MFSLAITADIHAPKHLELFEKSLQSIEEPDLIVLAGDVVYRNAHEQIPKVLEIVRKRFQSPIVACFGNEEWEGYEDVYRKYGDISWLDDEALTLTIRGSRVYIVGSRGSLDRPTFWQRTHVKGIYRRYKMRVSKIDSLLREARGDYVVVATHYAPTYKTLEGERERAWPEMGCMKMEEVIRTRRPLLWIHGHAHKSVKLAVWIGATYVINAALPARKSIVTIDLKELKSERLKRVWGALS